MNTKIAGYVGKGLQYLIAVLGVIFFILIVMNADDESAVEGWVSNSISLSQFGLYIAAGIAVLFAVYQFATNIKGNIKSLIGLVAFGLVIAISYGMASGQATTEALLEKAEPSQIVMSDTGLFMFYILIGLTILSILVAEVSRLFK